MDATRVQANFRKFPCVKYCWLSHHNGENRSVNRWVVKGDFIYLLEAGEVDIRHEQRTLEMVETGGTVGEVFLVDYDWRRNGGAIALEDATLIPINQRKFRELVQDNPDSALAVMARRIREMNERIVA